MGTFDRVLCGKFSEDVIDFGLFVTSCQNMSIKIKKNPKYTYNLADNGWKDVVSSGMLIGMVFLSAMGSGLAILCLIQPMQQQKVCTSGTLISQVFLWIQVFETLTTHSKTYEGSTIYSENLTTK